MFRHGFSLLLLFASLGFVSASAADIAKLEISSPTPYQVYQREDFQPGKSHEHFVTGAVIGYTDVEILGTHPRGIDGTWQFRVIPLKGAYGTGSDWMDMKVEHEGDEFHGPAEVNAGGWYRLEVRCLAGEKTVAEGAVEPFGVGEIFLVAGQSYAAGENDELLKVTDPTNRVAAFDAVKKTWQVANDPQPNVGDGGTIWPALGDLLVPTLRVPVGFVNVAVSATSSKQWLPDGELYKRLVDAGNDVGPFRAVLWQQGESDVIEKTRTDVYVKNMIKIRESAGRAWHFEPPWLLAKSTLHPTVYNDPTGEERIREAIGQLWKRPHFAPGPDTDLLGGENRGEMNSRRHFTGIGQRRAALLWYVAIWNEIEKQPR